jgi:hypothetical protein
MLQNQSNRTPDLANFITPATKYLKPVIPAPHQVRDKLQPVEDSDLSENPGGQWMPDQVRHD